MPGDRHVAGHARPIKGRAERVLTELETRQTGGDDALDQIETLVREREDALRAALYKPLLGLHKDDFGKVVRHILALLVSPGDAES